MALRYPSLQLNLNSPTAATSAQLKPVVKQPAVTQPKPAVNTPQQQILATSTNNLGGAGGGGGAVNTGGAQQQPQTPDAQAELEGRIRGEISGGYDSYFQSLDQMMGGLDPQRQAQEGIIGNNFDMANSDLDAQNAESQGMLDKSRVRTEDNRYKNLRDLEDNIMNQMTAGQVMLGASNAGDSSANNMYSYALNKLGTKQRTSLQNNTENILGDIGDRETKLRTVYTQEKTRLQTEKQNKFLQVAQWFGEQQNAIRQMRATGELGKSKDLAALSSQLLNVALNQLATVDAENKQRTNQLETWAMNNSTNIQQLKGNMAGIGSVQGSLPQFSPIQGAPQVSAQNQAQSPIGMNNMNQDDKNKNLLSLFQTIG